MIIKAQSNSGTCYNDLNKRGCLGGPIGCPINPVDCSDATCNSGPCKNPSTPAPPVTSSGTTSGSQPVCGNGVCEQGEASCGSRGNGQTDVCSLTYCPQDCSSSSSATSSSSSTANPSSASLSGACYNDLNKRGCLGGPIGCPIYQVDCNDTNCNSGPCVASSGSVSSSPSVFSASSVYTAPSGSVAPTIPTVGRSSGLTDQQRQNLINQILQIIDQLKSLLILVLSK